MISGSKLIEVCASCETAACWYGESLCQSSKNAGTVLKTVAELRDHKKENEAYWSDEKMISVYGEATPFGHESHDFEATGDQCQNFCKHCGETLEHDVHIG